MVYRVLWWSGHVLLWLVAFVLLAAGATKAFGFAPEDVVKGLEESGLGDWQQIIGFGAMYAGVMLAIPRTNQFGSLVASSYWGGAILMHMSKGEPFPEPAVFLVMVWVGSVLLMVARQLESQGGTRSVAVQ